MEKTKKFGKINLVCEPFDKRLKNFIDTEKWTYAKTMPEWLHEYIMRDTFIPRPWSILTKMVIRIGLWELLLKKQ